MVLFLLLCSLTLTLQVFASKQPLSPHFQNNHFWVLRFKLLTLRVIYGWWGQNLKKIKFFCNVVHTFSRGQNLKNKYSFFYDVVHMFSCFSLPALRIEQSAGSDVPSGETPPPQGELFSSFSIFHHHHYPDHTIIFPIMIIMIVITTITSS